MELQNVKDQKVAIALKVISIAKRKFNCDRFRKCPHDLVIDSLLSDFRKKFVFSTKDYQNNQRLYNKGIISWEALKNWSEKKFTEELLECNNKKVDDFFNLRRK